VSTRSRIALALPTGAFRSIYCHWDGYPAHVGRTLTQHYTDFARVSQLMDLGDLSALREDIGTQHPFDDTVWSLPQPDRDIARADWDAQYGRMCLAYGRDRGEQGVQARHHKSFRGLAMAAKNSGTEWLYLFMDGQWLFAPVGSKLISPVNLTILSLRYCLQERRSDLARHLDRAEPTDIGTDWFVNFSSAVADIDAQLATIA
jgi:hypothetical protein